MDTELKAKWVKALRSGEFTQGVGKFERDGKYCCLGVLCVVAGEPTVSSDVGVAGNWLFAKDAIGEARNDLAFKNDNGWSFPEIADYIENTL